VTRTTTSGEPAGGWLADEAIGLPDALAAATFGSAYAEHADGERGTLRAGALAALVVLDHDLLAEGPTALRGTKVTATIVGGRLVG
jgi:predicted amidohydrolase YtcJ